MRHPTRSYSSEMQAVRARDAAVPILPPSPGEDAAAPAYAVQREAP